MTSSGYTVEQYDKGTWGIKVAGMNREDSIRVAREQACEDHPTRVRRPHNSVVVLPEERQFVYESWKDED